MNNNRILKKIVIANNLKHFEVQEVFELGQLHCSSSLIKGFLAGSSNKNHEPLNDEQLEQFLNGLIIYARGPVEEPDVLPRSIENYILGLIDSGNRDLMDEIEALVNDARDALAEKEAGEEA